VVNLSHLWEDVKTVLTVVAVLALLWKIFGGVAIVKKAFTNDIPHLQKSLDEQTGILTEIRDAVKK
jgi:hypothetical protein